MVCNAYRMADMILLMKRTIGQSALKVSFHINQEYDLRRKYKLYSYLTFYTDIECSPAPPDIPTDPEYHLSKDDGRVFMSNIIYPELQYQNREWDSSNNSTLIARNYMANLR